MVRAPGLTVLLTNTRLVERGGSELYVRDLALGLLRCGHRPVVYSPRLGPVAAEINAATVPVIDALDRLAAPPDLIHGQHHLETMTALLHFPDTPAVFFAHGWLPWEETPPRFPRILAYVAVSAAIRDRLVCEFGLPSERVRTILNFVDLERFRLRDTLPPRPRRALLFGNAGTAAYYAAVAAACASHGIALDAAGLAFGTPVPRPETVLPQYDLVFAVGRSAIEAIATGASTILASPEGLGPLVTTANLPRLRDLNFGLRVQAKPCEPDRIAAEIERYDAADALTVSQSLRQDAGLDAALAQICRLYTGVVAEWRAMPRDSAADSRAASRYLRWVSTALGRGLVDAEQGAAAQIERLRVELEATQLWARSLERDAGTRPQHGDALSAARAEIRAMRATRGWRALEVWWRLKRWLV